MKKLQLQVELQSLERQLADVDEAIECAVVLLGHLASQWLMLTRQLDGGGGVAAARNGET